jgi:hypothetical protein
MSIKKVFFRVVGATQSAIGTGALILAFLLYFDFFAMRTLFNVTAELLSLNILILSLFGGFSLASGLFLYKS